METTIIDGIDVEITGADDVSEEEIRRYIEHIKEKVKTPIKTLHVAVEGDKVNLEYECMPKKFERIRRITGADKRIARQVA